MGFNTNIRVILCNGFQLLVNSKSIKFWYKFWVKVMAHSSNPQNNPFSRPGQI